MREFNVAVVGATGAVGNEMIAILEERKFPVREITFLASERSEGKELPFRGKTCRVKVLKRAFFTRALRSAFFLPEGISARSSLR